MSLTLPIEDLSRLKVSATLSKTGQPMLSLVLNPSDNTVSNPNPSGIYVSFQGTVANGCWTLAMEAVFEDPNFSLQSEDSLSLVPDVSATNIPAPTESAKASDWAPGMMHAPLSAEPMSSNSSPHVPDHNQSGMEMGLAGNNYLGWLPEYGPMDVSSTNVGQDPPQTISEQSVPSHYSPEAFDGYFPQSLPSSTTGVAQPCSTATTSISSSSPRYDEADDSDSTYSSQTTSPELDQPYLVPWDVTDNSLVSMTGLGTRLRNMGIRANGLAINAMASFRARNLAIHTNAPVAEDGGLYLSE
uniref:Uncharacterized protein n=1 Tax=Moniliophthora roreri TaxID=221103 RepID=A0A0W0FJK7_MONRR